MQLTSQLCRWCQIREDLYYAFEKCLESGLENPLREIIASFLTRVKGGMSTDEALDKMQKQIGEPTFRDLITAIRFNLRYRGDLPSLLEHMEMQMFRIEEEYTRRRISTAHDKKLALLLVAAGPAAWAVRLLLDEQTRFLFLQTAPGRGLLVLSLLFTLLAAVALIFVHQRINI